MVVNEKTGGSVPSEVDCWHAASRRAEEKALLKQQRRKMFVNPGEEVKDDAVSGLVQQSDSDMDSGLCFMSGSHRKRQKKTA
jgi:hypothetical protein